MWEAYIIRIIQELINWIYPKRCVFCQSELENPEADCCDICYNKVEVISKSYCRKCGKPRKSLDTLCYDCLHKEHSYTSGRGMFEYNQMVKKSLFGLKFFKQTWIGKVFGQLLGEFYLKENLKEIDLIIPVPLHFLRYLDRGFNQAEVIAVAFSKEIGKPLLTKVLRRSKSTKAQKDLTDKERHRNINKAFKVKEKYNKEIANKRILLIDDIYTTGATIDSCASELIHAGAKEVYFLTVAIGDGL